MNQTKTLSEMTDREVASVTLQMIGEADEYVQMVSLSKRPSEETQQHLVSEVRRRLTMSRVMLRTLAKGVEEDQEGGLQGGDQEEAL